MASDQETDGTPRKMKDFPMSFFTKHTPLILVVILALLSTYFAGRHIGRMEGERMGAALGFRDLGQGVVALGKSGNLVFETTSLESTRTGFLIKPKDNLKFVTKFYISYVKPAWYAEGVGELAQNQNVELINN